MAEAIEATTTSSSTSIGENSSTSSPVLGKLGLLGYPYVTCLHPSSQPGEGGQSARCVWFWSGGIGHHRFGEYASRLDRLLTGLLSGCICSAARRHILTFRLVHGHPSLAPAAHHSQSCLYRSIFSVARAASQNILVPEFLS